MHDNLNDIRDILSEYFKLKNYNTRKTEQQENSIVKISLMYKELNQKII